MTVDDFNESVGAGLPQERSRTMAGLVFDALGRQPREGDRVAVGPAELTVWRTDGPRIARLRIALPGAGPRRASAESEGPG